MKVIRLSLLDSLIFLGCIYICCAKNPLKQLQLRCRILYKLPRDCRPLGSCVVFLPRPLHSIKPMHCVAHTSHPASDVPHQLSVNKFSHGRNIGVFQGGQVFRSCAWLLLSVWLNFRWRFFLYIYFFPGRSQPSLHCPGLRQQRAARDREDGFMNWVMSQFLIFVPSLQWLHQPQQGELPSHRLSGNLALPARPLQAGLKGNHADLGHSAWLTRAPYGILSCSC